MAQYLMLIYETEASYANATPEDFQRVMDLHNAYPEQVTKLGGKILGGEALQPTNTATTIRGPRAIWAMTTSSPTSRRWASSRSRSTPTP